MKRLIALSALVILACAVQAAAQNKPAGMPTPISHVAVKGAGRPAVPNASTPALNMHGINVQLRAQMRQIPKDLKAGKITKAQAQAAQGNLRNIRKQELEFLRQNNRKDITGGQKDKLNQMLTQNAGSI